MALVEPQNNASVHLSTNHDVATAEIVTGESNVSTSEVTIESEVSCSKTDVSNVECSGENENDELSAFAKGDSDAPKAKIFDSKHYVEAPLPTTNPWTKSKRVDTPPSAPSDALKIGKFINYFIVIKFLLVLARVTLSLTGITALRLCFLIF